MSGGNFWIEDELEDERVGNIVEDDDGLGLDVLEIRNKRA